MAQVGQNGSSGWNWQEESEFGRRRRRVQSTKQEIFQEIFQEKKESTYKTGDFSGHSPRSTNRSDPPSCITLRTATSLLSISPPRASLSLSGALAFLSPHYSDPIYYSPLSANCIAAVLLFLLLLISKSGIPWIRCLAHHPLSLLRRCSNAWWSACLLLLLLTKQYSSPLFNCYLIFGSYFHSSLFSRLLFCPNPLRTHKVALSLLFRALVCVVRPPMPMPVLFPMYFPSFEIGASMSHQCVLCFV